MTSNSATEQIPLGTFFASGDLTPDRYAAMENVDKTAAWLMENFPEKLRELAQDVQLRYEDIAAVLIPSKYKEFPNVAIKAVGVAIRQLVPTDELAGLTHERRSSHMRERIQKMGAETFHAHQVAANRLAWANRDKPDVDAMLRGRGRIAWSEDEKTLLRALLEDPNYQHTEGQQQGRPDYALIALELNIRFHDCEPVRYRNSVQSMRNMFYR